MESLCELRNYGPYIMSAYGISAAVIGVLGFMVWKRKTALDKRLAEAGRSAAAPSPDTPAE